MLVHIAVSTLKKVVNFTVMLSRLIIEYLWSMLLFHYEISCYQYFYTYTIKQPQSIESCGYVENPF